MAASFIIISSLPTKGMKTAGNIALVKHKKSTLIERHINNIRSVYPRSEIIVVGGFEHKKVKKAVSEYHNITYVYHSIDETSNETESLLLGLNHVKNKNTIVFNVSCFFNKSLIKKIPRTEKSFAIINTNKNYEGNIGATISNNHIDNIFFNLPNKLTNIYYLNKEHINYAISLDSSSLKNKYLFEFMNMLNHYNNFEYKKFNIAKFQIINNNKDFNKIKV